MRLLKSIYGLKQASRKWNKFHQTLSSLGLKRVTSSANLYTMSHPMNGICIVLVYVDDILIVSDSLKWIESAKRTIVMEQFRMTDFGEAKFIVRMDIVNNIEEGTISLPLELYIKEILEKYNMLDMTPSKVPMAPTHYRDGEVVSDHDNMALAPSEHETFRAILGSVNSHPCVPYLTLHLRRAPLASDTLLPRNCT
jgi:hypothetical protein